MSKPSDKLLVLSLAVSPGTSGYRMHNAAYKKLGLDYYYLPRKYDGDIKPALEGARALEIKGVSLTMPYKISALKHLDSLSLEAKEIGAVNTVVNNKGKLKGYNTDAPASEKLIKENFAWKGKCLVILGSGGMAHAFAYAARKLKIDAYICSRNAKKAQILAKKFKLKTIKWGDWKKLKGTILCNATPIGMKDRKESIGIPENIIAALAGVFDAVANSDTALVKAAKKNSVPVVSGDMLSLEQACLQFKLYTGVAAPRDVMKAALYGR